MRLFELYESSDTSINQIAPVGKTPVSQVKSSPSANIVRPTGIESGLPRSIVFPDMSGFEFYRFVIALSSWPELDKAFFKLSPLRDIPIAVATSDREFEMIKQVAAALGKKWELLSSTKNANDPDSSITGNTVSPVMRFKMTENHIDIMKALLEAVETIDTNEDY